MPRRLEPRAGRGGLRFARPSVGTRWALSRPPAVERSDWGVFCGRSDRAGTWLAWRHAIAIPLGSTRRASTGTAGDRPALRMVVPGFDRISTLVPPQRGRPRPLARPCRFGVRSFRSGSERIIHPEIRSRGACRFAAGTAGAAQVGGSAGNGRSARCLVDSRDAVRGAGSRRDTMTSTTSRERRHERHGRHGHRIWVHERLEPRAALGFVDASGAGGFTTDLTSTTEEALALERRRSAGSTHPHPFGTTGASAGHVRPYG